MGDLLDGKVAIVTGGTSGIGLRTVEHFVAEGAKVMFCGRRPEGHEMAEQIGDSAAYMQADITEEASIEELVAETVKKFGRLDVMFNNAGAIGDLSPISEIPQAGFDEILSIDAGSVVLGHKFATRQFLAQGTGGSIISNASVAGIEGGWMTVGYTAAKHAVVGVARQAAFELGPLGIRSNVIAPGVVMTAIQSEAFEVPPDRAKEFNGYLVDTIGPNQAMGRFGHVDDISGVAVFLASELSSFVNGVVIPVDGGATAMTQSGFIEEIGITTEKFLAG